MELGGLFVPNFALVALVVGLATYYYYKSWFGFFRQQGIPGPTPWPLVGTMFYGFKNGFRYMDLHFLEKYGDTIGLYERGHRVLVTRDEELMREILVKDFNNFINRQDNSGLRGTEPVMRKVLTSLRDEEWKRVRSTLTPTFSTGKLKQMVMSVNECAELYVSRLKAEADNDSEYDAKSYTADLTMDVIARVALGLQLDNQTAESGESEFSTVAKQILDVKITNPIIICAVFFPSLLPLFQKLGFTIIDTQPLRFFVAIVEQALKERKSGERTRTDFLQLMVNAHKDSYDVKEVAKEVAKDGITFDETKVDKKGLSTVEIHAQGFVFLLAGYETISNNLTVLLYCLATHPEVQERAQQEVDEAFGDKDDLDYDDVQRLAYVEQCFNESMRLYFPIQRLEREAARDATVRGIRLPKGTRIGISVSGRHMDPRIWPEPTKYDPDRFSPENRANQGPFDHIPFGYGPRNCIAKRLSYMVVKMVTAHILRHYTLSPGPNTPIPLRFTKLMKFEKDIMLKCTRR